MIIRIRFQSVEDEPNKQEHHETDNNESKHSAILHKDRLQGKNKRR